jgi:hypothetical protein
VGKPLQYQLKWSGSIRMAITWFAAKLSCSNYNKHDAIIRGRPWIILYDNIVSCQQSALLISRYSVSFLTTMYLNAGSVGTVTVCVNDPSNAMKQSQSHSHVTADGQSASQSICSRPTNQPKKLTKGGVLRRRTTSSLARLNHSCVLNA